MHIIYSTWTWPQILEIINILSSILGILSGIASIIILFRAKKFSTLLKEHTAKEEYAEHKGNIYIRLLVVQRDLYRNDITESELKTAFTKYADIVSYMSTEYKKNLKKQTLKNANKISNLINNYISNPENVSFTKLLSIVQKPTDNLIRSMQDVQNILNGREKDIDDNLINSSEVQKQYSLNDLGFLLEKSIFKKDFYGLENDNVFDSITDDDSINRGDNNE